MNICNVRMNFSSITFCFLPMSLFLQLEEWATAVKILGDEMENSFSEQVARPAGLSNPLRMLSCNHMG